MPKYTVLVREVHVSHMEIEAENPEDAVDKVYNGDGNEVLCEYSHTLDSNEWTVDDASGKTVLEPRL